MTPGLTHLHVHSHFTLLGATPTIPDLVQTAAAQGMTSLALTDTNALYGAVAFARECAAVGIRPIVGMTVTIAQPEEVSDRRAQGAPAQPGELVLLARNPDGWRSLCGLSSAIQGRPNREEVAAVGVGWELLGAHRSGLIGLAGGPRSWLGRALAVGNAAAAARYASRLAGIYGEHAWLALELHTPADQTVADATVEIGKRFGMPVAAVQPVYYLAAGDRDRLRLLTALAHNCPLDTVEDWWLPDGGRDEVQLCWLTPDELTARFAAYPQALDGVRELVAMCEPALPDGHTIWPSLDLGDDATPDAALARLATAGLSERYAAPTASMRARLDRELAAIAHYGFAPLFLLVAEITRYAREREIPYNTRGSVANALTAYCVGITTVDPIAHDLLFERFLNPERANLPDIDLDFCSRRRDEVLAHVRDRFGAERVALVATVATLRPKSAVRETAKAYGLDEAAIDELTDKVRDEWHPDPRRRRAAPLEQLVSDLADPAQAAVLQAALGLVGAPHHISIHPGGVVVTPGPVTEIAAVQWTPKGFHVTQFAHEDVEALGLPKIDLLGIRALTVLADAAALVRRRGDPSFRLAAIPPDDALTGRLLARGDTVGVFQCESWGAQRTLRQLQARSVRDLAVANAFFKPGPAMGGMADAFIRRYRGEEEVTFLHPALAPILAATQGVLLFQEQVLRVATEIAGLSWAEADRLRRGMSKFRGEEMAALQQRFVEGCRRSAPAGPGMAADQAEMLWTQVMAFAGYGFNQGHATAYADVSYRSAYLKTHWPAEFLCARLADWGGFHHQAVYLAEARRLGLAVRPPHVNASASQFTLRWEDDRPVLWMGLGQVRDLRQASTKAIAAARRQRPFSSAADLLERVPLLRKEWTHLIQCGALDGLGATRAALLDEAAASVGGSHGQQLTLGFAETATPPETPGQRLAWEQRVLSLPVSVQPPATVALPPDAAGVAAARAAGGRNVTVAGFRLPGWTGGKGWFLCDGDDYAVAIGDKGAPNPRVWKPVLVRGRWRVDGWGDGWLELAGWSALDG
jgi:DNA-directed DNA polymerase III PolC